jgi:hypothetical protein
LFTMKRPRQIVSSAAQVVLVLLLLVAMSACDLSSSGSSDPIRLPAAEQPVPLLEADRPVDWWFVFKFNSADFPGCGASGVRTCPFGGNVMPYPSGYSQQFVYLSSENPFLQDGPGCLGDSTADPVGATFDQIYNGSYHYVVWNDQLYGEPAIASCPSGNCFSPWGHSKGMLAWNDKGNGLVMQVSTPSWPAAGCSAYPRQNDGNSLGCVNDDNLLVSQHFFSLRLTKGDVVTVLNALANASVVTDASNPQVVRNGGPPDIQQLVNRLGVLSPSTGYTLSTLSSGVQLISKPSNLQVPPWQMVSAILGGPSLRAATWWTDPEIPSTTASTAIGCWDPSLGDAGAVEIAKTGQWGGKTLGLTGGTVAPAGNHNHAKIGVTTSGVDPMAIFGDMNQQGSLSGPNCGSSQNGRGGLFFVVHDQRLHDAVAQLISGE